MILAEAILLALLLSVLTGGSLRRLTHQTLRGEIILACLLPAQLVWPNLSSMLGLPCVARRVVWLCMMLVLLVVLLVNLREHLVLTVAAVGLAANILVIALNGSMPVSIRSTSEIGAPREQARARLSEDCLHEEMAASTVLAPLADVLAIPGPPWQRSVVSIGDLLLSCGLAAWIFSSTRP